MARQALRMSAGPDHRHSAGPWWQTRLFVAGCMLLLILPLLWPAVPPLMDLPGHIGRYHIADAIGSSPDLQRHWSFQWAPIGNLGVDLLVVALAKLVGVEPATKAVVIAIPLLWGWGVVRLSRLVHGGLTPAAPIAFALVYGYSFHAGFVNFVLASALVLHALAWWMILGRQGRLWLRGALFVPVSFLLWLCHSFGWGMFGLFAFAVEVVRLRRGGASWAHALVNAVLPCLLLALPALVMRGGGVALDPEWSWAAKLVWAASLLRDRWQRFDALSALFVLSFLLILLRHTRGRGLGELGAAALIGFLAFLALPRLMLGGSYVDMRMLAPAVAMLVIAIPARGALVAAFAAGFFLIRMGATTISLFLYGEAQRDAAEALAHIPRGAAVLSLVAEPCGWASTRLTHIAGLAVARRDAFTNEQWALAGQQLLRPRHADSGSLRADPSQIIYAQGCQYQTTQLKPGIAGFSRGTFTHVWTVGVPADPGLFPDLQLIWSNPVSAVYQVRLKGRPLVP
ncbi:hypothetical protein [Sphingomonas xinjiangensis]|uniref:Glycosyltransferase RgtA/B/C/D-like domain-containing protein n=1 Tax=Sphingomonas xinjiangensis TaxID=643568 RepID=A0A840YRR1_9SPHN|nr:hypothetical protein [Sphingomonas xinjiangensis]MBB5712223.1 hypothetical protein [Sphingomonas xinjiangensis]